MFMFGVKFAVWVLAFTSIRSSGIVTPTIISSKSSSTSYNLPNQTEVNAWTLPISKTILGQQGGYPLELYCVINTNTYEYFNSKYLAFIMEEELMENSQGTSTNEPDTRTYQINLGEAKYTYGCYLTADERKLNSTSTEQNKCFMNIVKFSTSKNISISKPIFKVLIVENIVGLVAAKRPGNVDHISCSSKNWRQLKCRWDKFKKNYVKTNYTTSYTSEGNEQLQPDACQNKNVTGHFCKWTLSILPSYKRDYKRLKVVIRGVNMFDRKKWSSGFNQHEPIVPDEPTDLELVNSTSTSILLRWNIGSFYTSHNNWMYKILYSDKDSEDSYFICKSSEVIKVYDTVACNVTKLNPQTLYNFRVYMKSEDASSEIYWSQPSDEQRFMTESCPPQHSPETDVGSFYVANNFNNSRMVWLFWKSAHSVCSSLDLMEYVVDVYIINKNGNRSTAADVQHKWFFEKAVYNIGTSAYEFAITAENSQGKALNTSIIYLSAVEDAVKPCNFLYRKIVDFETYEIVWQPLENKSDIVDYTLFSCYKFVRRDSHVVPNIQELKSQPTKELESYFCSHWIRIPVQNMTHELSVNRSWHFSLCSTPLQIQRIFGVSINKHNSSSGILWEMGTIWQVSEKLLKLDILSTQKRCKKEMEEYIDFETKENTSLYEDYSNTVNLTKSIAQEDISEQKRSDLGWRMLEYQYRKFLRKLF